MKNKEQVPEEYDAPNRGEQVADTVQDYDYPTDADKEPELMQPDWSEDQPIPVYIVERPETPQILDWTGNRFVIGENAVEIVGARRNRTRTIISNEGTDAVFLARDMAVSTELNLRLAANASIEMLHNGAVWARCASGDTATVDVLQEYTVELDSLHA